MKETTEENPITSQDKVNGGKTSQEFLFGEEVAWETIV